MSNPKDKRIFFWGHLLKTSSGNTLIEFKWGKTSNNIVFFLPSSQDPKCIIMAIRCRRDTKLQPQFISASAVSHQHLPVSASTATITANFQKSPPFHIKISAHELNVNTDDVCPYSEVGSEKAGPYSEKWRYKGITGLCTMGGRVGGIDYLCWNT